MYLRKISDVVDKLKLSIARYRNSGYHTNPSRPSSVDKYIKQPRPETIDIFQKEMPLFRNVSRNYARNKEVNQAKNFPKQFSFQNRVNIPKAALKLYFETIYGKKAKKILKKSEGDHLQSLAIKKINLKKFLYQPIYKYKKRSGTGRNELVANKSYEIKKWVSVNKKRINEDSSYNSLNRNNPSITFEDKMIWPPIYRYKGPIYNEQVTKKLFSPELSRNEENKRIAFPIPLTAPNKMNLKRQKSQELKNSVHDNVGFENVNKEGIFSTAKKNNFVTYKNNEKVKLRTNISNYSMTAKTDSSIAQWAPLYTYKGESMKALKEIKKSSSDEIGNVKQTKTEEVPVKTKEENLLNVKENTSEGKNVPTSQINKDVISKKHDHQVGSKTEKEKITSSTWSNNKMAEKALSSPSVKNNKIDKPEQVYSPKNDQTSIQNESYKSQVESVAAPNEGVSKRSDALSDNYTKKYALLSSYKAHKKLEKNEDFQPNPSHKYREELKNKGSRDGNVRGVSPSRVSHANNIRIKNIFFNHRPPKRQIFTSAAVTNLTMNEPLLSEFNSKNSKSKLVTSTLTVAKNHKSQLSNNSFTEFANYLQDLMTKISEITLFKSLTFGSVVRPNIQCKSKLSLSRNWPTYYGVAPSDLRFISNTTYEKLFKETVTSNEKLVPISTKVENKSSTGQDEISVFTQTENSEISSCISENVPGRISLPKKKLQLSNILSSQLSKTLSRPGKSSVGNKRYVKEMERPTRYKTEKRKKLNSFNPSTYDPLYSCKNKTSLDMLNKNYDQNKSKSKKSFNKCNCQLCNSDNGKSDLNSVLMPINRCDSRDKVSKDKFSNHSGGHMTSTNPNSRNTKSNRNSSLIPVVVNKPQTVKSDNRANSKQTFGSLISSDPVLPKLNNSHFNILESSEAGLSKQSESNCNASLVQTDGEELAEIPSVLKILPPKSTHPHFELKVEQQNESSIMCPESISHGPHQADVNNSQVCDTNNSLKFEMEAFIGQDRTLETSQKMDSGDCRVIPSNKPNQYIGLRRKRIEIVELCSLDPKGFLNWKFNPKDKTEFIQEIISINSTRIALPIKPKPQPKLEINNDVATQTRQSGRYKFMNCTNVKPRIKGKKANLNGNLALTKNDQFFLKCNDKLEEFTLKKAGLCNDASSDIFHRNGNKQNSGTKQDVKGGTDMLDHADIARKPNKEDSFVKVNVEKNSWFDNNYNQSIYEGNLLKNKESSNQIVFMTSQIEKNKNVAETDTNILKTPEKDSFKKQLNSEQLVDGAEEANLRKNSNRLIQLDTAILEATKNHSDNFLNLRNHENYGDDIMQITTADKKDERDELTNNGDPTEEIISGNRNAISSKSTIIGNQTKIMPSKSNEHSQPVPYMGRNPFLAYHDRHLKRNREEKLQQCYYPYPPLYSEEQTKPNIKQRVNYYRGKVHPDLAALLSTNENINGKRPRQLGLHKKTRPPFKQNKPRDDVKQRNFSKITPTELMNNKRQIGIGPLISSSETMRNTNLHEDGMISKADSRDVQSTEWSSIFRDANSKIKLPKIVLNCERSWYTENITFRRRIQYITVSQPESLPQEVVEN